MSESRPPGDWETLRELSRDIGRLFESMAPLQAQRVARQFPAFNLYDGGTRFVLTAELPGLTSEDFELSMTGDAVTLRGARPRDLGVPEDAYRRQERPFGSWSRTIVLPAPIDGDRVTATLSQGVLCVVVPKVEAKQTRPIAVRMIAS